MNKIILIILLSLISLTSWTKEEVPLTKDIQRILKLEINASINPATYNYLKAGINKATNEGMDAVLLTMNTPGGLVSTTKDILTLIGTSDLPIFIWVAPEGASATSAGAIISSGAHLLSMAEGTNMGAAAPVSLGKDIDAPSKQQPKEKGKQGPGFQLPKPPSSDMKKKAVNDLVALVKSLSLTRGRNAELFSKMITEASSYEAQVAEKKGIIDFIANTEKEFYQKAQDRTIRLKGQNYKLNFIKPVIIEFAMDLGQRLLNIFANPSLAYILFLIGAALIYFEFQAPGGFIAGSVGVLCLLMAGIGFQVLPLNLGALGLIVLAFVLFILEIYITSYGLLSLAATASLVFGSLFLFRTEEGHVAIPQTLIFSVAGGIVIFMLMVGSMIAKDWKKTHEQGAPNTLEGESGFIVKILPHGEFQVKVKGEIWLASGPSELELDQEIKVLAKEENSMKLKIIPIGATNV